MMLMVASAAILLPLLLLAVFRMPAKYGMTISAAVVAALAYLVWNVEPLTIAASALQGLHRAASILWILLGAMTLLKVLEYTGAMERIKQAFYEISGDMRVQAVIVGLFFVSILEGLAGFGAPVAIAAPLLVSLGMRPMAAIVIALIGDSLAVAFGAVGTPILVGLSNVPGFGGPGFFSSITQLVTMVDFLIAIVLPLLIITALVRLFGENRQARSLDHVWQIAPWALTMGLVYAVSALVLSQFIGPEFISTLSGLIAMVTASVSAYRGVLVPRDASWQTHVNTSKGKPVKVSTQPIPLWAAILPYAIVVAGLLLTRLVPAVRDFAQTALDASWNQILGIEAVSSAWQVLFSPGTLLMLAALLSVLVFRGVPARTFFEAAHDAGTILYKAAFALFPTLVMVQIFSNSGLNTSELVSMPAYIAYELGAIFSSVWVGVAPLLGAIGAFITGSSTVSTLTMAEIQYTVAGIAGMPSELMLAQQLSGAAAGNMIAVHNIIAASAVVGVYHQEGRIIRKLLPFVGVYIVLSIVGAIAVSLLL